MSKTDKNILGVFLLVLLSFVIYGILYITNEIDHPKPKPVYGYLARNLEDLQVDTIYTYRGNIQFYNTVLVNMDSLWIDGRDEYGTYYQIIKKLK